MTEANIVTGIAGAVKAELREHKTWYTIQAVVMIIVGAIAAIYPLVVPSAVLLIDLPVLFVVSVLVLFFLYVTGRGIRSPEAALLLSIYIGYAAVRLVGPGS